MSKTKKTGKSLNSKTDGVLLPPAPGMTRRDFLRGVSGALATTAALGAAMSPAASFIQELSWEEFFQKHYKELSSEEKERVFARIKREIEKNFGVSEVEISDPLPMPGVEFAYALNLSKCIGCRGCVKACVKENNQDRASGMEYIRVLALKKGSMNLEEAEHDYDPALVPEKGKYYMPVQCHQCRNAPCVKVCPVEATWQESDGVVVVDHNWCIGCRYCEAACPYWARRFNFSTPVIPKDEMNKTMGYLSNRPRPKGVVEKCTFCLHRTRNGKYPACLEACPTGSRKFGNILDPDSEINYIIKNKRVFVLKEELNTRPRFYYYFD
jgi:Fe-S-cluster-containing dehydrogenase component